MEKNTQIEMKIVQDEIREDRLADLTADIARLIQKETDIRTELPREKPGPGMKGEPVTIGLIILTFISSGAAVALFDVLKSYFVRDSSLKITFKTPDGKEITLDQKNMGKDQVRDTLTTVQDFFEGHHGSGPVRSPDS
jgi:hypothetical protein